jgi:hypothetical protein
MRMFCAAHRTNAFLWVMFIVGAFIYGCSGGSSDGDGSAPSSASSASGSVSGNVVSATNNAPVGGATISTSVGTATSVGPAVV